MASLKVKRNSKKDWMVNEVTSAENLFAATIEKAIRRTPYCISSIYTLNSHHKGGNCRQRKYKRKYQVIYRTE